MNVMTKPFAMDDVIRTDPDAVAAAGDAELEVLRGTERRVLSVRRGALAVHAEGTAVHPDALAP